MANAIAVRESQLDAASAEIKVKNRQIARKKKTSNRNGRNQRFKENFLVPARDRGTYGRCGTIRR